MRLLSFFDVRGLPVNLHFPALRLHLYWLKERRIALPTEGSAELCCTVRVALLSAQQMKQHTCSRIENAQRMARESSVRKRYVRMRKYKNSMS